MCENMDEKDISTYLQYRSSGLSFETIHNIDEYSTETVSTMREALKVKQLKST